MPEPSSEIADTPTPDDIEAALSDLRAQIGAAEPPGPPAPPPPAPDTELRGPGWGGAAALMLGAALLGGVTAGILPGLLGMAPQGEGEARRIAELESRLGGLAAGQSEDAARQAFADIRAHLDGLDVRLRALEQASAAPRTEAGESGEMAAAQAALNALTQRVVSLETQLSQMAQQPASPSMPAPETLSELAALKTAIADLAARLGTLEQVAPAGDLIASLDGRVSALEQADPGRAARQAALALIVARLGDAAADGRGFAAELAALKAAAPAVDTTAFEPYAEHGLPTVTRLADQLEALDGAVREGADYDRGGDWFDRLWRGFGRLITVRQDGLAEGMEPEDHLARAEYHARRGDLANAYGEMDRLSGTARGAAALWIAEAGARLALDAALAKVTQTILADLARPAP